MMRSAVTHLTVPDAGLSKVKAFILLVTLVIFAVYGVCVVIYKALCCVTRFVGYVTDKTKTTPTIGEAVEQTLFALGETDNDTGPQPDMIWISTAAGKCYHTDPVCGAIRGRGLKTFRVCLKCKLPDKCNKTE